MLITEIILENFMSFEYARVPLKPGVNIICGPNGAGKSSILLGISVALGQSYTERSKKLSHLIKRGREQARVTIILDNSRREGKRPIRRLNKDQIFLTRELRRDGKYWFQLDNRAVTKREVERLLERFNVDPENLLIIMHQNMSDQFALFSLQEKLRTVEAAIGLEAYRKNVMQARRKLTRVISEEQSVTKLLEAAKQTLNYWREQYDRFQRKKQYQIKRRFLKRELVWTEVKEKEISLEEIEKKIKKIENDITQISKKKSKLSNDVNKTQFKLKDTKTKWRELLQEQLFREIEKARIKIHLSAKTDNLKKIKQIMEDGTRRISECIVMIEQVDMNVKSPSFPSIYEEKLTEIKRIYKDVENNWLKQIASHEDDIKTLRGTLEETNDKTDKNIIETRLKIGETDKEVESLYEKFIQLRVESAILDYIRKATEKQLRKLRSDLEVKKQQYNDSMKKATEIGTRVASTRTIDEILDEIRLMDGYLTALHDVSEDVEKMYESYSKLYLELEERARVVAENREKTLEEIDIRMKTWQKMIQELLSSVNSKYRMILSEAQAIGEIRLVNGHDIELAGLEVLVGFKGSPPVPLDVYTQSGGERSMATVSFLLALQQHVQSPFRAVDEYDVHMDPKNREIITNLLVDSVKGLDSQYLIITPSRLTITEKNIHIITVQNISGESNVKEVI